MSALTFSSRRLFNLFRYEFSIHRVFYVKSIPGLFLMVLCLFLLFFYRSTSLSQFSAMYYTELVLLIILGVGYSFVDLRNKQSAQVYLSLPGSAIEKYLVQFFTRVVAFPVLFTIMFVLAISLAKGLFHLSSTTVFSSEDTTQVIDNLDISSMILIFMSWNKPAITYFFIFGLLGFFTSLMFAGGVIFGKWNSLLMPLSIFIFWLLMIVTLIGLSWLVFGFPASGAEFFTVKFDLTQPTIVEGGSLVMLVFTVLIWLAIPWFLWVAYLKLKEREV